MKNTIEKYPDKLKVRIPKWIGSIDELAKKHNVKADRLRIMIHQFFLAYHQKEGIRKSKGDRYKNDFFPVYSGILNDVCTNKYTHYVNVLIKEGFVTMKTNGAGGKCYEVGVHSQLYKWNIPEEMNKKLKIRTERVTDPTTIKSVIRTKDLYNNKEIEIRYGKEFKSVYNKMREYLLLANIDENSEADFVNSLSWFVVDEFGRRLHTKFTSMKKIYRKFMRFKGFETQKLISLDIKNSQPYFLSLCSKPGLIKKIIPEFTPIVELACQYGESEDWKDFSRLSIEGGLYERFIPDGLTEEEFKDERKKVKNLMYAAVLFCKKRVFKENKVFQQQFKKAFPSVFAFTQSVRKCSANDLPELNNIIHYYDKKSKKFKNDSSRLMPCLLQRMESAFMFKLIAPKLIAKDIPFITIHDSFMVLESNKDRVKSIIENCFNEQGVHSPTLE